MKDNTYHGEPQGISERRCYKALTGSVLILGDLRDVKEAGLCSGLDAVGSIL